MAAMASRAIPVTPEIAIEDLNQGDNYRIEHRRGDWPPKTGNYSGLHTDYPKCAFFILDEPHVPKVHAFCTKDWTFHETYSESINMISKSKSLPNNLGKYLKTFGGSMKKTKRSRRKTRRQTRRR